MKIYYLLLVSFLMVACSVEGEIADDEKNKIIDCTDTRDGENFSYNTSSVRNIRAGIGAPHSMTITTASGRDMDVNSDMEAYIKCIPRK